MLGPVDYNPYVEERFRMPVYSYACKSCGHKFDIHQDFSDDSLTICPECQGQLKKVFGTVGISFKGSGFYQTDYRSQSYKDAAKADKQAQKSASEKSSESSSSKSETKSDTKSDSKPSSGSADSK